MEGTTELFSFGKLIPREIFVEESFPIYGDVASVLVVRLLEAHVMIPKAQAVGYFVI